MLICLGYLTIRLDSHGVKPLHRNLSCGTQCWYEPSLFLKHDTKQSRFVYDNIFNPPCRPGCCMFSKCCSNWLLEWVVDIKADKSCPFNLSEPIQQDFQPSLLIISVVQIDFQNDGSASRQTLHVDSINSSWFIKCRSRIDSLWVYWRILAILQVTRWYRHQDKLQWYSLFWP